MIILIQNLSINTVKLFLRKHTQKLPALIQSINNTSVLCICLTDKLSLKCLTKLQILLIQRRKLILTNNRSKGSRISNLCITGKQLVGNVLMVRNSRDALAAALLDLGYDINTTDEAQIREAYELLADAKSKGVYQSFVMDEVFGKMEGSNAAIAMYYAGDYLTMLDNNPDLKFVVPKEGSNWFVDAMCVLKTAQHKEEAEAWINFIASTESNLANMDYIGYASPNLEALEGYPAYYEETYGEPLDEERYEIMAAPDDVLARCELYTNLPADTLTLYNDLWTELGI